MADLTVAAETCVALGATKHQFESYPGRDIALGAFQAPRSWAERAYHNLVHFNALAKGGHFAAWEQPQLFQKKSGRASDRCADSGQEAVFFNASSRMGDHVVTVVIPSAAKRLANVNPAQD